MRRGRHFCREATHAQLVFVACSLLLFLQLDRAGAFTVLGQGPGGPGNIMSSPYSVGYCPATSMAVVLGGTDTVGNSRGNHLSWVNVAAPGPPQFLAGNTSVDGFADGQGYGVLMSAGSGYVAMNALCTFAYFSDARNYRIRYLRMRDGVVGTLAGSGAAGQADGVGTAATFQDPRGLAFSSDEGRLYVYDSDRVRYIDTTTLFVKTVGTTGSAGWGIAELDSDTIMYAGANTKVLGTISVSTHAVTTLAGLSGTGGFVDGVGTNARMASVSGLAYYRSAQVVFVGDVENSAVRMLDLRTRNLTTVATVGTRVDDVALDVRRSRLYTAGTYHPNGLYSIDITLPTPIPTLSPSASAAAGAYVRVTNGAVLSVAAGGNFAAGG